MSQSAVRYVHRHRILAVVAVVEVEVVVGSYFVTYVHFPYPRINVHKGESTHISESTPFIKVNQHLYLYYFLMRVHIYTLNENER